MTVPPEAIAPEPELAVELRQLAKNASEIEQVIWDVEAILNAIDLGALDGPGHDDIDSETIARMKASTCGQLLDLARRRFRSVEDLPGTDMSCSLACLASDAEKGLIARRS